MRKGVFYRLAAAILLILGIICAVWAGSRLYEQAEEAKRMDDLRKEAGRRDVAFGITSADYPASSELEHWEEEIVPIDFSALRKVNPDIYAWITIPGTQIDYPILQKETGPQDYYLYHDVDGELSAGGSIYTENLNKKDFSDPNTVIYGHNMKDGTMFRELHRFREKDFFDRTAEIYIYTPGHRLTYQVFSAYESDDRHILKTFDFSVREEFVLYLEEALHPRSLNVMKRDGVTVTVEDKIITLSTCIGKDYARYLVQAVLKEDLSSEMSLNDR